jgi:hypothetical protein
MIKTLLITVGTAAFILLTLAVVNGTGSNECEVLYSEYSSTVEMSMRTNIFDEGIANGCFHNN